MRETNIFQWITLAVVASFVYVLFRFGKAGTDEITRPPMQNQILPNVESNFEAIVSENPQISLAANYLRCDTGYNPAVSSATLRAPINYCNVANPMANCMGTASPYEVAQPCTPPVYRTVQKPCTGNIPVFCSDACCSAIPV